MSKTISPSRKKSHNKADNSKSKSKAVKEIDIPELLAASNLPPEVLDNRATYIETIRKGIPGTIVENGVEMLNARQLFINLLSTSSSNLNRFYHKPLLSKSNSEGILDFIRVFQYAIEVFEDENIAHEWFHTKIPVLYGECPINICDTFEGRKSVHEALEAIEYGEFS